jgi:hypothetical protein
MLYRQNLEKLSLLASVEPRNIAESATGVTGLTIFTYCYALALLAVGNKSHQTRMVPPCLCDKWAFW